MEEAKRVEQAAPRIDHQQQTADGDRDRRDQIADRAKLLRLGFDECGESGEGKSARSHARQEQIAGDNPIPNH